MTTLTLQRPAQGQTLRVTPQADNNLMFDFNSNEVTISLDGLNLNLSFNDGATIILEGFYETYTADQLPELHIQEQAIDSAHFFASLGQEILPAAGVNTNFGGGSSVQTVAISLLQGINRLESIDQGEAAGTTQAQSPIANPTVPTTSNTDAITQTPQAIAIQFANDNTDNFNDAGSGEEESGTLPPLFYAQNDILAADSGSRLTGNLLANDNLPEGTVISNLITPEGWRAVENVDGSITYTLDEDTQTSFTIYANGDYILTTNIENVGIENFSFSYEAMDLLGNVYDAQMIIGNAAENVLRVDTLEGQHVTVTTENGNSYIHEFSSYAADSEIGNQHVNGLLLGAGDDEVTVENAIGSQTNPQYAGVNDTFIYGDALRNEDANAVGHDVINITNLDGTKVRADGNLYENVIGGNDTVNVENMEGGSIIGDGWHLYNGSEAGNDEINVHTMNGGEIFGDGVSIHHSVTGVNDSISVDNINTINGNQNVTINGGVGNDTINIGNIESNSGDYIRIDGGLGDDIFNYDSDDDETMAMLGSSIYIAGQGQIAISNFEGIGSGAGNDLIKLYDRADNALDFDGLFVDAGQGMDVLLANLSNINEISDMLENNDVQNTEVIVLSDDLNNAGTTSSAYLFNELEDEGVSQNADGSVSFDNTWSQGAAIGEFDSYTNQEHDITILVARTQAENTMS